MKNLELELQLDIKFRKYGIYFKCECERYGLVYRSLVSFEDAEKQMLEDLNLKLWSGDYLLKIRLKNS